MEKLVLLIALAVLLMAAAGCTAAAPTLPGKTWHTASPAEVGMNQEILDSLASYAGGRGCVIRHGKLVYSWGDITARGDVASAAKVVYSYFLQHALDTGRIPSVDQPVVQWESRLTELGEQGTTITWRDFGNQTVCYGLSELPGTAYDYNDWAMALFWDTLFFKVYGTDYDHVDAEVFHPQLTDLIGCEDNPTLMAFGKGDRPGRLGISPRDFARLGLLYLHGGKWGDQQLLSPLWAKLATSDPLPATLPRAGMTVTPMLKGQRSMGSLSIPDNQCEHEGSYSWLWWTNGVKAQGKRNWPDAPYDTYGAFGHGGPRAMVVIPSLDLIFSYNDCRMNTWEMINEALGRLVGAVTDAPANLGAVVPDAEKPQWLKTVGDGTFLMAGPGDPEGFLFRGTLNPDGTRSGDQEELIQKLAASGANCLYLMAVRSHGGDGDATQNPFVDNDPAKPLNEAVLAQWDGWLSALDKAGVATLFFIYDDSANVYGRGQDVSAAERRFVTALVQRFSPLRHLIWCIAEEYAEVLPPARVSKLAAIIREADTMGHPIAVHKNDGLDFSEFAGDPNLDQFAVQYNLPTAEELHAGLVQAFREAKGRYNLNMSEAADWGTGAASRHKAWASAMAGAHVMAIDMDIATTPPGDLADMGRLARFFSWVDLDSMAPQDELAAGRTHYVLAGPASWVLYSEGGEGALGLSGLSVGHYDALWFDCESGKATVQRGLELSSGGSALTPPATFGPEVACYLVKTD